MLMLDRVRQRVDDFDVLHFHIDQFQFPLFRSIAGRTVTTLHGRQDLPDLLPLYLGFGDMPLVSISDAQRRPVPHANFAGTVHHGIPVDLHRGIARARASYLAFLGRISPEKRPDRAISIARALGIPLKIAAKVDRVDEVYFKTQIEPLLQGGGVEFIGEINDREKTQFLGDAQGPAERRSWLFAAVQFRRSSRMASQALLSAPWKRRSRPCRASLPSIEKRYVNASNSAFPPHEWRKTMSVYIGRYWRYPPSVSSRILCFRQAARI